MTGTYRMTWPVTDPTLPLAVAVAWIKRRGKGSPGDWYVAMTGTQFVSLMVEAGYFPDPAKEATA